MKKIKKIIVIVGPTATGKTDLALHIAKSLNSYIISGDSMQIYHDFKIGTAQPDLSKINVPYYLVDLISPVERFSAFDFKKTANEIISKNTTIPIIAGGTGFYINSFLRNYTLGFLDDNSYQNFLSEFENLDLDVLVSILKDIDPAAYENVDLANKRRVLRALAIKKISGKSISDQVMLKSDFEPFIIGLNTQRLRLYDRIEKRVDQMMDEGLLDEARRVYDHRNEYPLLSKAIAYKEFFPYFDQQCDLSCAVSLLKQKSRNYAKRQLTWFNNKMEVNWYDISDQDFTEEIDRDLSAWLNQY